MIFLMNMLMSPKQLEGYDSILDPPKWRLLNWGGKLEFLVCPFQRPQIRLWTIPIFFLNFLQTWLLGKRAGEVGEGREAWQWWIITRVGWGWGPHEGVYGCFQVLDCYGCWLPCPTCIGGRGSKCRNSQRWGEEFSNRSWQSQWRLLWRTNA